MLTFIAFILGALRRTYVSLVGQLPIAEGLNVLVAPVLLFSRSRILRIKPIPTILIFGAAYLGSQVLSDVVNSTPRTDYLRGWANIGMMLLSFATFALVFPGALGRRYGMYLLGLAIGGAVLVARGQTLAGGSEFVGTVGEEFWNIRVQPWSGPAMVLLLWWLYNRSPKWCVLAAIAYAMASVVGGARAHALPYLGVAAAIIAIQMAARGAFQLSRAQIVRYAVIAGLVLTFAFLSYVTLGLQGLLGTKTRAQLVVLRQPYNPLQVILVARGHTISGILAIADKPLLGHGSWARDRGSDYEAGMRDFMREWLLVPGAPMEPLQDRDPGEVVLLQPGHSHILAAWVWGGAIGGAFWIAQLVILTNLSVFFIRRPWCSIMPVAVYALVSAYWNIIFSPFGFGRSEWPALAALLILYRYQVQQYEQMWALQVRQQHQQAAAGAFFRPALAPQP